ncbi:hypothetical protein IJ750_07420 [bacterium]|nr:hypothetical protein [bacterium]
MSTNINASILKKFIVNNLGIDKLNRQQAQEYDIKNNEFLSADVDENNYLDVDEILDNKDLYAQFATLYVEEKEKEAEAKSADQEKEEQTKVKDKNGAGV